jgi:hypothetical protein
MMRHTSALSRETLAPSPRSSRRVIAALLHPYRSLLWRVAILARPRRPTPQRASLAHLLISNFGYPPLHPCFAAFKQVTAPMYSNMPGRRELDMAGRRAVRLARRLSVDYPLTEKLANRREAGDKPADCPVVDRLSTMLY